MFKKYPLQYAMIIGGAAAAGWSLNCIQNSMKAKKAIEDGKEAAFAKEHVEYMNRYAAIGLAGAALLITGMVMHNKVYK